MKISINLESKLANMLLLFAKEKKTDRKKLLEKIIVDWVNNNQKEIEIIVANLID